LGGFDFLFIERFSILTRDGRARRRTVLISRVIERFSTRNGGLGRKSPRLKRLGTKDASEDRGDASRKKSTFF